MREPGSEERIWWGDVNEEIAEDAFEGLREKVVAYLDEPGPLRRRRVRRRRSRRTGSRVRVVTDSPWHALFAKTLFIDPTEEELDGVRAGGARAARAGRRGRSGGGRHAQRARSSSCTRRAHEVLIGGTYYAGEIKKSIFTVMNDRLPLDGVFPMHCSANVGDDGRVAVFFGLSGHGQDDALGRSRAAPDRRRRARLGRRGRLQLRGRLLREGDPALRRRPSRRSSGRRARSAPCSRTSSSTSAASSTSTTTRRRRTRAPRTSSSRSRTRCPAKRAGHPSAVVFLTADAFGVLPPIARLTREQAMFYFLSGYTAKVAGTEIGVTEPQPTFSACFGAPFLPQPPAVYAHMLGEKLDAAPHVDRLAREHRLDGRAVRRGRADADRGDARDAHAALSGELDGVEYRTDEVFGFEVPVEVPGVDSKLLDPRSTWRDPDGVRPQARELAQMFRDNFEQFADDAGEAVAAAGPRV